MNLPKHAGGFDQPSSINLDSELNSELEQSGSSGRKPASKKPKNGKMFLDLLICILIPTLILKKLSPPELLGANWALILALSLPLTSAIVEFVRDKKIGFVAALGFISILLTGGIGLLQLPKEYIAIKEAMIPAIIGLATLASTYTKYPLVRTFLYNDMMMDTEKVAQHLQASGNQSAFDHVMVKATWILASSFMLSAILNYVLAKWIVVSPSGSEAFNSELGSMNLLSYPVIVLPCMVITIFALFYVIKNITRLTGLKLEEIVHQ